MALSMMQKILDRPRLCVDAMFVKSRKSISEIFYVNS